ncbi:hypothetical protein [Rossellomorea marisflavi]|nr:hypothetical protein [Rossellomorea marisflavi]
MDHTVNLDAEVISNHEGYLHVVIKVDDEFSDILIVNIEESDQ